MLAPQRRVEACYLPENRVVIGRRSVAPIVKDQQKIGAVLLCSEALSVT